MIKGLPSIWILYPIIVLDTLLWDVQQSVPRLNPNLESFSCSLDTYGSQY